MGDVTKPCPAVGMRRRREADARRVAATQGR